MVVFIQYALISLIVYLGLAVGAIVSKIAEEELPAGKRWFIITRRGLAAAIAATLFLKFHLALPIVIAIILFLMLTFKPVEEIWAFPAAAILLPISARYEGLFFVESTLMFLLGMVTAALAYDRSKKLLTNLKSISWKHTYFLVISLVLYFLMY